MQPPTLEIKWIEEEKHKQIHQRMQALISQRARTKASLEFYSEASILKEIRSEIMRLTSKIEKYQKTIEEHLTEDPNLKKKSQILQQVTGIGPAVSSTLLITFPELGTLNGKQAAALAGLAPMNRDSGAMRGRRTIQAGRRKPRQALYMAALTAAYRNPMFQPFYQDLKTRGKPTKVALCAVARKLLIHLNTLLKETSHPAPQKIISQHSC
ncbi:MAG: transposase [Chthoniobacterales bacterium]